MTGNWDGRGGGEKQPVLEGGGLDESMGGLIKAYNLLKVQLISVLSWHFLFK